MGWPYVLLAVLSFAATPAVVAMLVYRLPGRPAKVLSSLLLGVAWWGFAYSMELAAGDPDGKVFWESARFVGVVAVPSLWLVFALQYTGRDRLLTRGAIAGLVVFLVLTMFLVVTNASHGLVWSDARLVADGPLQVLELDHGPWFWVIVAYSYGVLLLGAGPVISSLLGHHRPYRMQSALLLLAVLVPWAASGLNLLWADRLPGLDLTPLGFPLTAALLLLGVRRYRLLDISPIARDTAAEGMGAAVIILDPKYRVVDLNPAAEKILGKKASEAVGQTFSDVTRGGGMVVKGSGGDAASGTLPEGGRGPGGGGAGRG